MTGTDAPGIIEAARDGDAPLLAPAQGAPGCAGGEDRHAAVRVTTTYLRQARAGS